MAVADSARRHEPRSFNLLPGQEVFTVASVQAKVEAQLRCLGCGFLAEPLAREHIRAGRLVVKARAARTTSARAWAMPGATARRRSRRRPPQGLALALVAASSWQSKATRKALLERHTGLPQAVD